VSTISNSGITASTAPVTATIHPKITNKAVAESERRGVHYRALNLDSKLDLQRIVRLYRQAYGADCPWQRVYSHSFWQVQSRGLNRQHSVHLVAESGGEFAAHLGLRGDGSAFELFLAACDPGEQQRMLPIIRDGWSFLLKLGQRQRWSSIFFYCQIGNLASQFTANKCFKAYETAIIPNCLPDRMALKLARRFCPQPECRSVMLMWRPLGESQPAVLYPPLRHIELIQNLYAPLGLSRQFIETPQTTQDQSRHKQSKIDIIYRSHLGLQEIAIDPGYCDVAAVIQSLQAKERPDRPQFVKLRLDNPLCPLMAAELEERAFSICGIQPALNGDCLIYAHTDGPLTQSLNLYSARAKRLWNYIQSNRLQ
jgi:hypothetical protein